MKFVSVSPFSEPDAAARRLMEIANAAEAVQDGRIHIELINAPSSMLGALRPNTARASSEPSPRVGCGGTNPGST